MKAFFIISVIIATFCSQAFADVSLFQDIKISAAVDLVNLTALDSSDDNKLRVRAAEVMFFGPLDPTFDANLNIAGHDENGEFVFELHEGFVSSSKLIPQSRFRVGKFFLNVGRLNQFHQHDWPFLTAPVVHREFFNPGRGGIEAEGAADTGIEYTWMLPTDHFFDITLGVTNGYCYGHCHEDVGRPKYPVHYIHPTTYFSFGTTSGLLLGASYLGRIDGNETKTELLGLDVTYKKRVGKTLRWLVQSEAYYQSEKTPGVNNVYEAGFYVYTQYGHNPQWSYGLRLDAFSHLNRKFDTVWQDRDQLTYAVVPTLTYTSSEFAKVRLAYSHEVNTLEGVSDVKDRQLQLQFVLILGEHPAHDF